MAKVMTWESLAAQHPMLNVAAAQSEFERMLGLGENAVTQTTPLSLEENALLDGAGFRPANATESAAVISRTAAAQAALVGDAVLAEELARALNKTPGRVRQMISEGKLVSMKVDGHNLLPRFQFTTDDSGRLMQVPHSNSVFSAIPAGLSPIAIANWFQLPDQELYPADLGVSPNAPDEPLSPKQWLLAGFDPKPVIATAQTLAGEPTGPAELEHASPEDQLAAAQAILSEFGRLPASKVVEKKVESALKLLRSMQKAL